MKEISKWVILGTIAAAILLGFYQVNYMPKLTTQSLHLAVTERAANEIMVRIRSQMRSDGNISIDPDLSAVRDAWGQRFGINILPDKKVEIRSPGSNGEFNDEDDYIKVINLE